VSFFSEERASELRELFFETAQELLQALNDEGMELEKRPTDAEIIRTIRRTVHTLKGDAAACGFAELSDLAHELEDALVPEKAARDDDSVAQLVLSAADIFDAMLAALRDRLQAPDGAPLRELIRRMSQGPVPSAASGLAPEFAWSEYERLVIAQGAAGAPVYNVGIALDPACSMRAAALQVVRNVLLETGKVLVMHPEEGQADHFQLIEAAIASERDRKWIESRCRIPGIASQVVIMPLSFVKPRFPAESAGTESGRPAPIGDLLLEPPEIYPGALQAESPGDLAARSSGNTEGGAPGGGHTATPAKAMDEAEGAPVEAPSVPQHSLSENILRVDADRIDTVLNLLGELIVVRSALTQSMSEFSRRFPRDPLRGRFADTLAHQSQVLNELQRSVMKIRMVPVEQLFRRFPRVVRDLGKMLGKDVALELAGQNTDLDKSILDILAEPMTHLVRNAVDHGIEPPEERAAAGKPAQGCVRLHAYHQGNQVVIEVQDDGRGVDRRKVAAKALASGLIGSEELARMGESEILALIFEPGFSTASEVTQISGRGIGLDVVKAVLERMKGSVSIHTEAGKGTTFQLRVPLTLAIIKALLFRVGSRLFAVPLSSVLEIARVRAGEIHRVDRREVLQIRGEIIHLVRLHALAGEQQRSPSGRNFVVVVGVVGRKFGLMVDRLTGEEELVIKALDNGLISTDLVSGASILGDGTVVLILNPGAVVERLGRSRGKAVVNGTDQIPPAESMVGARA
jgi:two-component system chemotaxis sensor kinase CheA